jgi:hypothetical protein
MPEFQDAEGEPLIHTDTLAYDGNSQGGILGGSLVALSPDMRERRARRAGCQLLDPAQPVGRLGGRDLRRPVLHRTTRTRSSGSSATRCSRCCGTAARATATPTRPPISPAAQHPPHRILLHPAWADYQVANIAAEVQARTLRSAAACRRRSRRAGTGRTTSTFMFDLFDIEDGEVQPHAGSALVYFDSGNSLHPSTNLPPRKDLPFDGHPSGVERDPHSDPAPGPPRFGPAGDVPEHRGRRRHRGWAAVLDRGLSRTGEPELPLRRP